MADKFPLMLATHRLGLSRMNKHRKDAVAVCDRIHRDGTDGEGGIDLERIQIGSLKASITSFFACYLLDCRVKIS